MADLVTQIAQSSFRACNVVLQESSPTQWRKGHAHADSELRHAQETADMYERQVADLLISLKKADRNWEHAEKVRGCSVAQPGRTYNRHQSREPSIAVA